MRPRGAESFEEHLSRFPTGTPTTVLAMHHQAVATAVALALSVTACGTSKPSTTRTSTQAQTNSSLSVPVSAPVSVPPAAPGCDTASPEVVDAITRAFTEAATLSSPQMVESPDGLVYVGGNIDSPAGERLSNDDVWLVKDGSLFALSGDARRRTSLPDGRGFASAGDEYGTAVQECVPNTR